MIQPIELPDVTKANIESLRDPLFVQSGITVDVMRLDKIHAVLSGNKWFKLRYYLEDAVEQQKKGIITFGGAYSNHLVATACACHMAGLNSIGFIRGEEPANFSPSLQDAQKYGMKFHFVSRSMFKSDELFARVVSQNEDYLVVEEGGRGRIGIRGAEEVLALQPTQQYTHIICAVGTGTTLSALVNKALPAQKVIGIPVLKLDAKAGNTISAYVSENTHQHNFSFDYRFHFGGYAKKSPDLIAFMNSLYESTGIRTDFVYTGKVFYSVFQMTRERFFTLGSKILIIHTGGLQGNRSLPEQTLAFSS